MKVRWEASDIICGRRVTKNVDGEKFIIGYDMYEPPNSRYLLVSLKDGMLAKQEQSKKSLAVYLTKEEYLPVEVFNEAAGRELF